MSSTLNQSGVTQLEFHQAMNDFKHMFPEMEEVIIEQVLRDNNGVVDATIDQLLRLNSNESLKKKTYNKSNLYEANRTVKSSKSYKKSFHDYNETVSKDSLRYQRRWDPPLLGELSPSFLRICLNETQQKLVTFDPTSNLNVHLVNPVLLQQKMEENERNRQITSLNDDPELSQFLKDERFAILLQNEEFVRELRSNRDFISTLDSETRLSGSITSAGIDNLNNYGDSDAAFKEKLKNMGKVSKKKFSQLARMFSGRTKKNFRHLNDSTSKNPYLYEDLNDSNYEDNNKPSSSNIRTNVKY